jgi:hypothetical protein
MTAIAGIKPAPVGKRPKCLCCGKELRAQYEVPGWRERPVIFESTDARRRWELDHPKRWTGKYGGYSDGFFCGLTCGHRWAVHRLKQQRKAGLL